MSDKAQLQALGAHLRRQAAQEGTAMDERDLREALADYAHEAWAGWMRWLFDRAHTAPDGSVTIPAAYTAALRRQMTTLYTDLSQAEQDADRAEADKMLALIEASGKTVRLRARADEWANVAIGLEKERVAQERQIAGLRAALQAVDEQSPQHAALRQAARAVLRTDKAHKARVAFALRPKFTLDDIHRYEPLEVEMTAAAEEVESAADALRAAGLDQLS